MRKLPGLIAAFLLGVTNLFAQGSPIDGTAQLGLSPSAAQVATGSSVDLEVTVDLSGVTGQTGAATRGPAVLGAYVINVSFDRNRFQLTAVNGGSTSQFSGAPTATDISNANASGSVTIASQQTSSSAPTGNVSVASLTFTAIGAGSGGFSASASSLSSAFQASAPNSPAAIPSNGANTTVTVGSAPGAPTLISPSNGATGVNSTVTLTWSAVSGAERYIVHVGTTASPQEFTTTTATSVNFEGNEATTYFWRVVAQSALGENSSSTFSFTTSGTAPCLPPGRPSVTVSRTVVQSGETYTVSWNFMTNAGRYIIEEATRADFVGATSSTTTSSNASFKHDVTAATTYFYRVRGENVSCAAIGENSATVSVLVQPKAPPVTVTYEAIIPVVGSAAGNLGSFFKTSVQLFNPTSEIESGRIIFHRAGTSGSVNDPSLTYTLRPGEIVAFADLLTSMGQSGVIGSADVVTLSGNLPVAVIRIFNDAGAAGTSGMTEPLVNPVNVAGVGDTMHLITPISQVAERMNIGVRTLTTGATLSITLRDAAGVVKKTLTRSYAPTWFEQITSAAFLESEIAGNDTISVTVTAGRAIVYGATTDNKTQDPSLQLGVR